MILTWLGRSWPQLVFVLLILAMVVAVVAFLLKARKERATRAKEQEALRRQDEAAKKVEAEAGGTQPPPPLPPLSWTRLHKGFTRAHRALRSSLAGRDLYDVPQFLVIGEPRSGKTTALESCGLDRVLSGNEDLGPGTGGTGFWFFERAAFLEVGGQFFAGGTASDGAWDRLLRLIQRHRPRRPLDGIVLTVPTSLLVGPDKLGSSDLVSRGEWLYHRLVRAQRLLGTSFPIYVLMTKTDVVRGFSHFSAALPPPLAADVLGWSSPYALSTAFSPGFIDEGFDAVLAGIHRTQLELLAEIRGGPRDSFFLFPDQFEQLRRPLATLLAAVFRETAYHSPFYLRGFYFSGDADPRNAARALAAAGEGRKDDAAAAEAAEAAAGARSKVYFLRRLFAEKVIPERGLARPARTAALGYGRTQVACTIGIALVAIGGGLGMVGALDRLGDEKRVLVPALAHTADALAAVGASEGRAQVAPSAEASDLLQQRARELLGDLSRVETTSVRHLFLPSSWLSGLNSDIRAAFATAFDKVIFHGIHANLDRRAFDLYERPLEAADRSLAGEPARVEDTPEFRAFAQLVEGSVALERNARLFNGLNVSGGPNDLGQVVRYTFDTELPAEFGHSDLFEDTLDDSKHALADTGGYRAAAGPRFKLLSARVADRMFLDSPLIARLTRLAAQFKSLSEGSPDESDPADTFSDLVESIRLSEEALASGEGSWIGTDRLTLNRETRRLLLAVNNSTLLGPSARDQALAEFERGFRDAQPKLRALRSPVTGLLLAEKDGRLEPRLAPLVVALKQDLGVLLDRPFMRRERGPAPAEFPVAGTRLAWDSAALDRAVQMVEPYKSFLADGLGKFPPELQQPLSEVATRRVQLALVGLINRSLGDGGSRASAVAGEDALRGEIDSLKQAEAALTRLLDHAYVLDLPEAWGRLVELIGIQGEELVEEMDRLLVRDGLYQVKGGDLAWWDGSTPLAAQAFGVAGAAELGGYLEAQRERVRAIARDHAAPVVRLLGATRLPVDELGPGYLRWLRILAALDAAEKMQPGNSVAALEQYIAKDLADLKLETCLERTREAGGGGTGGDYFASEREALRQRLRERCVYLVGVESRRAYGEIERWFNAELAGRFPFAADASNGTASLPAIRDLYRMVDPYLATYLPVLATSTRFGLGREQAIAFLKRLGEARPFFAGWLDAKTPDAMPVFDLTATFRVNREAEVGGDGVIDWSLAVGNQQLGWRDKPAPLRWVFGAPVSVRLRWAKDAPVAPVAKIPGAKVNPTERVVVFEGQGGFALLELLARHAPEPVDFRRGRDEQPHTLVFVVPTRRVLPAGGDEEEPDPARIFLRLELKVPDGPAAVVVPRLPDRAPPLPEPGAAEVSEAR